MAISSKPERTVQERLPFIVHNVDSVSIVQRAYDGYIDATALCRARARSLVDYSGSEATNAFLAALSSVVRLPATELIQVIEGGDPELQGTWVHPQVAINLGRWASHSLAVLVSRWVLDWMGGNSRSFYHIPHYIRRYLINRRRIPATHFSILDLMTLRFIAPLEAYGYILPPSLIAEISMGKMFSAWCEERGHDPSAFPTYKHEFDDRAKPPVQARLYPNQLQTEFREYLNNAWLKKGAIEYFRDREQKMIPVLRKVIRELPPPVKVRY